MTVTGETSPASARSANAYSGAKPVVLASGSAIRRQILSAAGVAFEAVRPVVDESAVIEQAEATGARPGEIAIAVASAKAAAAAEARPDAIVIAADQLLVDQGRILQKARRLEEARARLLGFRGRSHALVGGIVLQSGARRLEAFSVETIVSVETVSEAVIDAYLQRRGVDVLASVACYEIEGEGAQFLSAVDGDHFAALGLPLFPVLRALRKHGGLAA